MAAPTMARAASGENPWGAFSDRQSKCYAQNRRSYSPKLYETILDFHKSTGGRLQSLVDVGCGPGVAVRDLAEHFSTAVGLDSSEGMIDAAREMGGSAASGPIRFELSAAEELGTSLSGNPILPDGSVDLIIAANSAHYFDQAKFWAAAARILRAGGSVAIWASRPVGIHPSVPNAAAIEKALFTMQQADMAPYEKFQASSQDAAIGSKATGKLADTYCGLLLPWHEQVQNPAFDEGHFYHKEWSGRSNGDTDEFFASQPSVDLDSMEQVMGSTAGPYLEWRKAHPELAGTEQDLLRRGRREIERLQREVGVAKGEEWVKTNVQGALLIVKKRISTL